MFARLAVLLLLLPAAAHAQEPAVEAPAAKEAPEEAPSGPAAGTPEQVLRDSLLMMKAQKGTEWMDTLCTPGRCKTEFQRSELERYMLKQAQSTSKNCLHGDKDELQVKSVKGDPAADAKISITLVCSHSQYPPAAVLEKVDGKWYVTNIPW